MYSHFGVLIEDGAITLAEFREKVSEHTDATLRTKSKKRQKLNALLQLRARIEAQIDRLESELFDDEDG